MDTDKIFGAVTLEELGIILPNPNFDVHAKNALEFRSKIAALQAPKFNGSPSEIIDQFREWICAEINNFKANQADETSNSFRNFGLFGVSFIAELARIYVEISGKPESLQTESIQECLLEFSLKIAQKIGGNAVEIRQALESDITLIEELKRLDAEAFRLNPKQEIEVVSDEIAFALNQTEDIEKRGCPATGTFRVIIEKLAQCVKQSTVS